MRDYASLYLQLLADLDLKAEGLGPITSDMDQNLVARGSLAKSFYSKLCPLGNTDTADKNALEKFVSINRSLGGDEWEYVASSEVESLFWDYFKNHLRVALEPHESLGSFDYGFIREHMGVGPGAAQKADSTCMINKLFMGPMSYTHPDLIPLYRTALSETGYWADAEMRRFQEYGFVSVEGVRIFFAPKKAEISRVCGTESNLGMIVQKAAGEFIEQRLGMFYKVYLDKQPDFNRELARIGSLDGSIGTIDLESASDSIMLRLCELALPRGFLKTVMMMSRSRVAILPDGSQLELKMMSTMGNGFTFPLQTLIFSCVVRSVYDLMGFPSNCPRTQFGVFGDDICVRREAYEFVCRMLTKLGFKVNVGKSFNTGLFRESCGHDYFAGVNVRGVYIRSLESSQHVYSAINRLTRWSALHGVRLTRTIQTLLTWTRDLRVPPSESDDSGIHVPFKCSRPSVDARYWFEYRYYKRRLKRQPVDEEEASVKGRESALAVGFLAGVYRRPDILLTNPQGLPWTDDSAWKHDWSVSVTLRDKMGARVRYKIATRSLPWWDYLDPKMSSPSWEEGEWRIPLTRDSYSAWESTVVDLLDNVE